MLFHTFTFWIFFVIVASGYAVLGHRRQNLFLLAASYFFYGWWDWRFLSLILLSTTTDWLVGRTLGVTAEPGRRKALVGVSLTVNLGMLCFFKYLAFFAGEYCRLVGFFGAHCAVPGWITRIILPVGISFYTFQTLGYVMDVYRRRTVPVQRWTDYALYHAFFPQMMAGPIERSTTFLQQILKPRPHLTAERFNQGLHHVLTGLFKKLVVADNLAPLVNHVYNMPAGQVTGPEAVVSAWAFAFQIYGDFSGYSSIAQGLACWLGFDFSWNFRMPYLATSPQIFWQRWHISLSSWLRDYVFMPLVAALKWPGMTRIYVGTLITWLVSGIWHGANWTYAVWGGLHGVYLVSQLVIMRLGWFKDPPAGSAFLARLPCILVTFNLMCVGMILFRSKDLAQTADFFGALAHRWSFTPLAAYALAKLVFFAAPLMIYEVWIEKKDDMFGLLKVGWGWRALAYCFMVFMLLFFPPEVTSEFIYFQF